MEGIEENGGKGGIDVMEGMEDIEENGGKGGIDVMEGVWGHLVIGPSAGKGSIGRMIGLNNSFEAVVEFCPSSELLFGG